MPAPGWQAAVLGIAAVLISATAGWLLLPHVSGIPALNMAAGFLALVAGTVLFLATVRRPMIGMWVTLLLLGFGNTLTIPELIVIGRYLPTGGIALFAGAVAVRVLLAGRLRIGLPLAAGTFTLFGALVALSGFIHGISFLDTGLSLVVHLRYPLFFLAILALMPPAAHLVRWITGFVVLAFLQIPASLFQFFIQGRTDDWVTGTLGTNSALADVLFAAMTVLVAWWIVNRRQGLAVVVGVSLLALPLLYGFILAFVFSIVPLSLLFMLLVLRRTWALPGKLVAGVAAALIIIGLAGGVALASFASDVVENQTKNVLLDLELASQLSPTTVNFGSIGRLTILPLGLPVIFQNPADLLLGLGPETAQGGLLEASTVGQGIDETGLARGEVGGAACRLLLDAGLRCREPQSFRALVEFGVIGTALYLAGLVMVAVAVWRATQSVPPPQRWAGIAFGGYTAGLAIQFFYTGIWRVDSAQIPFWVLAATAIVLAVEHASRPGSAQGEQP